MFSSCLQWCRIYKELTFTLQATKYNNIFGKQQTKSLSEIKIKYTVILFFPMKFSRLKPVVAEAVEAAEPRSADLLSVPLSTCISSAPLPFGLSLSQNTSSPHTSPVLPILWLLLRPN